MEWGGVTYSRRYVYTLSTQKAHGSHIWEDDYIAEDFLKISKQKVIELGEWNHNELIFIDSPHTLL